MGHHSVEQRDVIFFAKFLFSVKKGPKFLNSFETDLTLATAFLNFDYHFLQTHLKDSFAPCLAALATSHLRKERIFPWTELFCRRIFVEDN